MPDLAFSGFSFHYSPPLRLRDQGIQMHALIPMLPGHMLLATTMVAAQPGPTLNESFDADRPICLRSQLAVRPTTALGPYGRDSAGVRVGYVGYPQGSQRIVFRCPLPTKGEEYTFSYDVRFDKDFQFVRGGKLHGLGPDRVMSGGNGTALDGWSARVVFHREGRVGTYVYNQEQKGRFGLVDWAEGFRFEPGRFYRVTLYARVNSAADAGDGVVRLYIDAKKLVERSGIRYRGVGGDRALITSMLFSTFHGGGDPTWAPKDNEGKYTTVYADFDNFDAAAGPPAFDASGDAPLVRLPTQKQR